MGKQIEFILKMNGSEDEIRFAYCREDEKRISKCREDEILPANGRED
jgi:hypothetical protein